MTTIERPMGAAKVVVVGIRDQAQAAAPLGAALDWAAQNDASIVAVHVFTYAEEMSFDLMACASTWRADLRRSLHTTCTAAARERGVPVTTTTVEAASVASGLLEVANAVSADLIVTQVDPANVFHPALNGLHRRARCPVLTVPAPSVRAQTVA